MSRFSDLVIKMTSYEDGNSHNINHFLKVFAFAKSIGEGEGLDTETQEILEVAAIVHDIGIKSSMKEFGNCNGPNQEKLGEPIARKMLLSIGYSEKMAERVAFLVGHHHTYNKISGKDYQILVEADFIVNLYEGNVEREEIETVKQRIFKTNTGITLLENYLQ